MNKAELVLKLKQTEESLESYKQAYDMLNKQYYEMAAAADEAQQLTRQTLFTHNRFIVELERYHAYDNVSIGGPIKFNCAYSYLPKDFTADFEQFQPLVEENSGREKSKCN